MLLVSLVLSAILLALVCLESWRTRDSLFPVVVGCALVGLCSVLCGMMFLPPVLLQCVLLIGAAVVSRLWRRWRFVPLAFGATLLAYIIPGAFAYHHDSRLLAKYPYVSLEDRLPTKGPAPAGPLPQAAVKRLDHLESAIEEPRDWFGRRREGSLRELHEDAVQAFADQSGFGVARMPRLSEWAMEAGLRKEPPLPQPGPRLPPASLTASLTGQPTPAERKELERELSDSHASGVVDFVHPDGFGYFKDRQHVAGFQSHQFSQAPSPGRLRLQTLDLVGLLLHDEPVVYISDHLPRMDELREAPTRPLDDFETAGLAVLRRGEDLFVQAGTEGARALGAVRSTRQCLSCHGGQRGDLLGAFSYTFTRPGPQGRP
jgi:hypothetical protein